MLSNNGYMQLYMCVTIFSTGSKFQLVWNLELHALTQAVHSYALSIHAVRSEVIQLQREITEHLNDGRRGERLRSGIHVTIIGAPNAGKSSLLNILCKQKIYRRKLNGILFTVLCTCRPAPCCNSVSLCRHYQGCIRVHSGHLWLSNYPKVLHEIVILLRI